jgi:hypothetical protein
VPSTSARAQAASTQRLNATGMFFGIKYAIPAMVANGGGSIINLSSIAGIIGSEHVYMAYNASKAAVGRGAARKRQDPRQLSSSRNHAADAHIRSHRRSFCAGRTHARHSDAPAGRS